MSTLCGSTPDTGRHHLNPNVPFLAADMLDPDRMSARRALTVHAQTVRNARSSVGAGRLRANHYVARHATDGGSPVARAALDVLDDMLTNA